MKIIWFMVTGFRRRATRDCMFTYLVTGLPEKASKFHEEYVENFGEPRAQAMACVAIAYCHQGEEDSAKEILEIVISSECNDPIIGHVQACLRY